MEKTLVDQIINEMFAMLEGQSDFDAKILENFKLLAKDGDLKKVPCVTKAIKSEQEGHDENH